MYTKYIRLEFRIRILFQSHGICIFFARRCCHCKHRTANGFYMQNQIQKSKKKIVPNALENQFPMAALIGCSSSILFSHIFFFHLENTSSNSWHSHGWKDRNWAVAIHHIGHKVKSMLSCVRPRCTRTQLWISWTNSMHIHCCRTSTWYCWVQWNWTQRCEWYYKCRYGLNELFTFRFVLPINRH